MTQFAFTLPLRIEPEFTEWKRAICIYYTILPADKIRIYILYFTIDFIIMLLLSLCTLLIQLLQLSSLVLPLYNLTNTGSAIKQPHRNKTIEKITWNNFSVCYYRYIKISSTYPRHHWKNVSYLCQAHFPIINAGLQAIG